MSLFSILEILDFISVIAMAAAASCVLQSLRTLLNCYTFAENNDAQQQPKPHLSTSPHAVFTPLASVLVLAAHNVTSFHCTTRSHWTCRQSQLTWHLVAQLEQLVGHLCQCGVDVTYYALVPLDALLDLRA
jgi:hypothetical protein